MHGVQFPRSLEAEQARYIHRTVPTAALGGLLVVVLVVIIFRSVVPERPLYVWLAGFVLLTAVRAPGWLRFRTIQFDAEVLPALASRPPSPRSLPGRFGGSGRCSSFRKARCSTRSSSPSRSSSWRWPRCSATPRTSARSSRSWCPRSCRASWGWRCRAAPFQLAFAIGLSNLSVVVLWSRRSFNSMFVESMRLRFENLDLVTQLTQQKEAAEAANLAKSRFLAAASQRPAPAHSCAESVSRRVRADPAAASGGLAAGQGAPVRAHHGRHVPHAARRVEARCRCGETAAHPVRARAPARPHAAGV